MIANGVPEQIQDFFYLNIIDFKKVSRVQKIKIPNLSLKQLLIVKLVKKKVYLEAHYSERQGLMG